MNISYSGVKKSLSYELGTTVFHMEKYVQSQIEHEHVLVRHPSSPANCFAAAAEVGNDHHNEMCYEPDIDRSHVLVDVDQDENAGHEDSEQDIGPLRYGILRVKIRKQEEVNEQDDAREKQ